MFVKMSSNDCKGVNDMQLSIRYDDDVHRKLKVIAAYREKSLNSLIMDTLAREVSDWEREHGAIKFPES